MRLLYDRGQPTARLIVRSKRDLETPLVSTYLRYGTAPLIRTLGYDALLSSCYEPHTPQMLVAVVTEGVYSNSCLDLGNMGVRASMSIVRVETMPQSPFTHTGISLSLPLVNCGV